MRFLSDNLLPRIELGFALVAIALAFFVGWEIYNAYTHQQYAVVVIHSVAGVLLLSVLGALHLTIRWRIIRPVERLTKRMSALASGELGFTIPSSQYRDEMGRMFEALEVFRNQAIEIEKASTWLKVAEKEAHIGYWRLSLSDNSLYWSDGVYRIHGMARSDYTPDIESAIRFYHPNDRGSVKQAIDSIRTSHQSFFMHETRIIRPNGDIRHVESSAQVERDAHGHIVGVLGVFQDVTEARQQRLALERHQLYLEDKVDARTSDLLKAKNQAEQANMFKSDFIMNVSHELRTPMHAIISLSRIGKEKFDDWDRDHHIQNFEMIQQSSERLMLMINDLLDMSKLESGKMQYHFGQHDIVAICRAVMNEVRSLLHDKHLSCELKTEHEVMTAYSDKPKVAHILSNLLSNAIKFTPEGKSLYIHLRSQDDYIICEVIDQGVGVPEDEWEAVFEKFYQSSKTRNGAGGTGLGLSICREMMTAMHGSIGCRSNPEGGSIFYFSLPEKAAKLKSGEVAA